MENDENGIADMVCSMSLDALLDQYYKAAIKHGFTPAEAQAISNVAEARYQDPDMGADILQGLSVALDNVVILPFGDSYPLKG